MNDDDGVSVPECTGLTRRKHRRRVMRLDVSRTVTGDLLTIRHFTCPLCDRRVMQETPRWDEPTLFD